MTKWELFFNPPISGNLSLVALCPDVIQSGADDSINWKISLGIQERFVNIFGQRKKLPDKYQFAVLFNTGGGQGV